MWWAGPGVIFVVNVAVVVGWCRYQFRVLLYSLHSGHAAVKGRGAFWYPSESWERDHRQWPAFFDRLVADFGMAALRCECWRENGPTGITDMSDNIVYTNPELHFQLVFIFHSDAVHRGVIPTVGTARHCGWDRGTNECSASVRRTRLHDANVAADTPATRVAGNRDSDAAAVADSESRGSVDGRGADAHGTHDRTRCDGAAVNRYELDTSSSCNASATQRDAASSNFSDPTTMDRAHSDWSGGMSGGDRPSIAMRGRQTSGSATVAQIAASFCAASIVGEYASVSLAELASVTQLSFGAVDDVVVSIAGQWKYPKTVENDAHRDHALVAYLAPLEAVVRPRTQWLPAAVANVAGECVASDCSGLCVHYPQSGTLIVDVASGVH